VLTNDGYGRFTLPMLAGLSAVVADYGFSTFLCADEYSPDRLKSNIWAMLQKGVDGLVITGKRIDSGLPVDLPQMKIPVVYVHSSCPDGAHRFISDDFIGAQEAVAHLIGLGRRRIAHVTGPYAFLAARLRADGWRLASESAGLEPFGDPIFGHWTEAHGYEAAERLFATSVRHPDAVFCGNDQIARGLIDGLRRLGHEVPEDVAVVGFDNWEVFSTAARPPLTTVDPGMMELGRSAGELLIDMMGGKSVEPGTRMTRARLVVRQSCGAAT
jgi:LacI family transcriptional regulator